MSRNTKIALGILVAVVVLCVAVVAGGSVILRWVRTFGDRMMVDDPEEAAAFADTIAEYDLPPGYQEQAGINLVVFKMLVIAPSDSASDGLAEPIIMLMQTSKAVLDDADREDLKRQMQTSAEREFREEGFDTRLVAEEETVIAGDETTLFTYEGTDEEGNAFRQVLSDWFVVNEKPTLLMIMGPIQGWDEDEIDAFIHSIR